MFKDFNFLKIEKRKIIWLFLALLFLEIISFSSYHFTALNTVFFILLTILVLALSFLKLEWGLYLLLIEVLLNPMGNLFFWQGAGLKISWRMSIWFSLLLAYFIKSILQTIKTRKISLEFRKTPYFQTFLFLALFVTLALIRGLSTNDLSAVLFDFNSWLYFLILFPLGQSFFKAQKEGREKIFKNNLILIFFTVVLFIIFKSLLLLFIFAHNLEFLSSYTYYWMRFHHLGEITAMSSGFYRIFLQNQVFLIFSFLAVLLSFSKIEAKKWSAQALVFASFLMSVIVLSLSRSFWLGLVVSLILFLAFLLWQKSYLKSLKVFAFIVSSLLGALLLIFLIAKFPWPSLKSDFNFNSISERTKMDIEESAISSRWTLLKVMQEDLKSNFLLGRGFGASLEYQSSDPRVLERDPEGLYTTYAFEWGWLDIWLKLGLLGLITYLFLLFMILRELFCIYKKEKSSLHGALFLSLTSLIVLNFFTPYLNHPLGIAFLLFLLVFLKKERPLLKLGLN